MTKETNGKKVFLAVDLGAGSGRVMAAAFDGVKISLEEVSRWASAPIKIGNSLHWDTDAIFGEIVGGIKKARAIFGNAIESVGIDSWAVDYGLLDSGGNLLNKPFIYRDARTAGMMEKVFAKIPKPDIYSKTGIQFLFFNTIYQIEAEILNGENIQKAKSFLMMPDLFAYMLTGEKFNERTNASSTQFYNPFKRDWDFEILERIGRAKSGQMVAIIKDMEKLRAEEIADTFKVVVSKIEKGEMKFFVVRDLFLNFDAYKGKIVDAIGKSTVPIKAGDMAALRTMYNSDTGNMNTVLETMVKRGTLTDEQITEIKEQRKS